MNTVNATGIVISAMPIGEYDKRLVILTREFGKITAFVRGARRMNSPYMAGSRPFSFGEFSLFRGRDSFSINGMKISNYFDDLTKEIENTYLAMYFLELADYYSSENVDGTQTIQLLYQTFKAILNNNIPNRLIKCIFELKILEINGEYPEVFHCVKCKKTDNLSFFCINLNGIVCDECIEKNNQKDFVIDNSELYTIQYIISSDISKLYTFNVTEKVLVKTENVVQSYLKTKTDKKFKALELLESL